MKNSGVLWTQTAQERAVTSDSSAIVTDRIVDVAIVGGGYTGLSTALHTAEAGLSVHLFEAHEIGHGGSGRNVGLVNAAAWLPPAKVRKLLGEVYGPRFLRRFGQAPSEVFDLIERHQIQCDATKTGTLHAALSPRGMSDLAARHIEWDRMAEPVHLLGPEEMQAHTGSTAFAGGLLDLRAGTIQPLAYCRGLARAAIAAGARIGMHQPVTSLTHDGALWRVETAKGTVMAKAVVLGTNAYADRLWPGLKDSFVTMRYFQISTAPLGDRASAVLPQGQGLWTNALVMMSLRRDRTGRLVFGGMGPVGGHQMIRRWAQRQLSRLYPEIGTVTWEAAWDGQIAMTPDHLPRICQLADGLYAPIGYNGRGITTGTVFGKALAGLLAGDDPADLPVPLSGPPKRLALAGMQSFALNSALTASQLWGAR